MRISRLLAAAAVSTTTALLGCAVTSTAADPPATTDLAEVSVALDVLPVKGRAPRTGYSRGAFGEPWSDAADVEYGHNTCDTRNDILRRDLTDPVVARGGCVVTGGVLHDPYTGTAVEFTRGANTSARVQIDHIVALSDAWQKGAQQLTPRERLSLANDPRNLQATVGATNQSKGDGDAATWLPPNKSYRCTYVSRQIQVKTAYRLWVTEAEKAAMARQLATCGVTDRNGGHP